MTLDLLPGFAEGTAATNRRLADDVARVPDTGDVRQAVRWTLAQATAVTELWEDAKDLLRSPQPIDDALKALTLVNAAAATWLSLSADLVRRLHANDPTAPAEIAALVQRLGAREAEIREAFDTMRRWLDGLHRRRPIDPARLERANAEAAAGRWVPLKEVRDRLAGGKG